MSVFVPHDAAQRGRLERERAEHDAIASSLDPEAMAAEPAGRLERAVFAAAGIRSGMRVCDLGCGSGDLSLQLLKLGVDVTGVDLSPGMVEVARRRARQLFPDRPARFIAAPVEASGLEPGSFDAVVGRFILHHIDLDVGVRAITELLAPGARAGFAENSARNPLLMFARRSVAGRFGVVRLGTTDERPLSRRDVETIGQHFAELDVTFPVFDFFRIFDRQVFGFRRPRATRVLDRLDDVVERRLRWAHPYSFRVVIAAVK